MPGIIARRRRQWYLAGVLLLVAAIANCGGQPSGPTPPPSTKQTGTGVPLVTDRSAKPADVKAPGIQVPSGSTFSVSIGKYNLVITANAWNTIIGSSHVTDLVGVQFDPDFNATDDTTRNRFQYLADEISQHYGNTNFEPLSIVAAVSDGAVVDDAAFYNATDQVGQLSGLTVTITNDVSSATVASETFYGTPGSAIIIPARTIYFTRLTFSSTSIGPSHNGMYSYSTQFRYSKFAPCPGQVCSS
jgi:hypothetical protein